MQSSSNGMLPVLGLLACAAAAGVFAAHKWPQGPPDSLLGAWDFVSCAVLHHHAPAAPARPDYGPAPRFDASPTGLSAPENCASSGNPAPPVVIFDESPSADERARAARKETNSADHREEPSAASPRSRAADSLAPAPIDVPPGAVRPASADSTTNGPSQLDRPPRCEPPKTSAFWPKDLSDLLPGAKSVEPSAQPRSPTVGGTSAAPGASAPAEPRVEECIRRLEQMGAVVVRLERQRGPGGNYLFRCELPMPQNPRYHRFFQAVDSQPARAAERVTHEVEAWRRTLR